MRFMRCAAKPAILLRSRFEGTIAYGPVWVTRFNTNKMDETHDFIDYLLVRVEVQGETRIAEVESEKSKHG